MIVRRLVVCRFNVTVVCNVVDQFVFRKRQELEFLTSTHKWYCVANLKFGKLLIYTYISVSNEASSNMKLLVAELWLRHETVAYHR